METQPWSMLSQNRDDLVVFAVKILSLTSLTVEVPLTKRETGMFSFPQAEEPLFTDILIFPQGECPADYEQVARYEAAEAFWQQQVLAHLNKNHVPYTEVLIKDCVETAAAWFSETNFLPNNLRMDLDQLLPETTRFHTWYDSRRKITRVTPIERRRF